ncbi:cation-translocating P-type ATPase [Lactobacillus crispatus]|jgi:HAD ATPase, P-type, family IC|uniref:P-type Ca(2+) transporter n=1 Tax=Lactobacillus crispatus TaxID=47770 RepID=A0A4Q0LPR4_9LACO|nr:cation-translocating P-type ATPase [Lactobacillus crispatus]STX16179.1 cation-transporting atpase, p-type [Lactobacillus acidophilus]EEJ69687.1 putative potassium/sodium efflux P-type ATPase, fungal-type [Lactobacillus crispatus JV-V01]KWU05390.1 haloacid dehalogenase [Lactobacillus crispatus]MBI1712920.1 haloacid dehalogenase [Lactobacillus crispatus]MCZ3692467.1 cation-translocating P-type ATPase [Lactobacillus crispatus]
MDNHRQKPWAVEQSEVLTNTKTTETGLTEDEVRIRQQAGLNELAAKPPKTVIQMVKEQIFDPMIGILLVAALLSAMFGEYTEAIIIATIVVLNTIIGVVQEKKAQSSLAALRDISAPTAHVIRNGKELIIPAKELVVGDIVTLHDGDMVPADLRLIETANLKIQEASLTGESVPVEKDAAAVLNPDCALGDRINMAFSSSIVTYGRGQGVVTAIGMQTEMGAIAGMLEDPTEVQTPLKRKLAKAGMVLTTIGLIICSLVFAIGAFYGRPLLPQFLVAISLAISIIPEGLPATATIVMALGVKRMVKRNALIKKLPAVETLGNATVICSDKTGTLTLNKMTVTQAATNDFSQSHIVDQLAANKTNQTLAYASALCNDASLNGEKEIGDPTEVALILFAQKLGFNQSNLKKEFPRLFEQPFDSDRKRMTTLHKIDGQLTVFTKGATDEMLPLCTHIMTNNGVRKITPQDKKQIAHLSHQMQAGALRVLGFATKIVDNLPEANADLENNLTFIGIVGMIDSPRKEVAASVKTCREAGIRTIMITGDHKVTALAIAKKLNIYQPGDLAISGTELDQMSDAELDQAVEKATVFARVSPADKLRIIQSLKRNGEVTAMTGDGVNDSPALKAADIGVAMGVTGTDVADMILLDDSFTTIAHAIKEGRRVYRNIQKVIQFLLVGNIAEITTLFAATIFNWDAPLLAVHILWVNLATATLPALALGVDPASKNIMKHKPVKAGTLFEKDLVIRVITQGIFVALLTLTGYFIGKEIGNQVVGQTMAFSILALAQMIRSFNQHSNTDPIWKRSAGNNPWLTVSFIISAFFMGIILFVPAMQDAFHITSLSAGQWLIVIALALLSIAQVELVKGWAKFRNIFINDNNLIED